MATSPNAASAELMRRRPLLATGIVSTFNSEMNLLARSPLPLPQRLALGAAALGTLALGAIAIGALAIRWLAVGRLVIGSAKIGALEVQDLKVRRVVGPAPVG